MRQNTVHAQGSGIMIGGIYLCFVPLFLFKRFFMVHELLETFCCKRSLDREKPLSWSLIEEISSSFATFWSHVDDIVSVGNDIQMMFYDENGVLFFYEARHDRHEFLDIGEVETGCRLIHDIEGFSG